MTPVLGVTMLAVARTCFGFQSTFQKVRQRSLYSKRAGDDLVNAREVLSTFGLVSRCFRSLLADFFAVTVTTQKCEHARISWWKLQIEVCCFQPLFFI